MDAGRVIIYSQPSCGYCNAAKRLLSNKGAEFTEIDVMLDPERRREMIERRGGLRTVPQIFIDGRHIGGFDDLRALDEAGELDPLLAAPAPKT